MSTKKWGPWRYQEDLNKQTYRDMYGEARPRIYDSAAFKWDAWDTNRERVVAKYLKACPLGPTSVLIESDEAGNMVYQTVTGSLTLYVPKKG